MAEVDPLILEIRADLSRYRAQLQSTTSLVTTSLGRQEKSVQNLERQMQRSSGAISGSLKGIAGAIAGAFSVQQIGALVDNFTRLQNSLRVAGLEGEGLANVQAKLLDLSGRYGVSINELANLYGKSSQAAADLGASEAQLLQITEASAQALKITGTSAVQAQGALLGLTQALSSGIVRAEEFNQINEGGLRPLLQVAANTERFGGSVAKLRAAVVEGQISSQEFYQAILQGSAELEGKASKATLTLAGAFTALAGQLTVYVGEASAANGVTAGLAGAIDALADNLDTIIPLLAIIATGLGVGLVTNAIAARVAVGALGTSLLAAFGGPIGLAVTALTVGIGYLVAVSNDATRSIDGLAKAADQAEAEAENMEARLKAAGVALDDVAGSGKNAADGINATKRAAEQAQKRLKDLEDQAGITALKLNQLRLSEAQDKRRAILATTSQDIQANAMGRFANTPGLIAAQENQAALLGPIDREIAALRRQRDAFIAGGRAGVNVSQDKNTPPPTTSPSTSRASRATGLSGPSAEEIRDRFNNELVGIAQQTLSAQQSIAKSAEDKAELELRSINLAKIRAVASIEADENYSGLQKERLVKQIEELATQEREAVAVRKRADLAQEAADLADIQARNAVAALQNEYDLATSIKDRARIAAQIAETETQAALDAVDRQLLDKDISDAKRQQLDAIRAGIVAAGERSALDAKNGNLTPTAQYLKEINESNFGDEADKFGVAALKDLNAGLADAIVNGGNLGDVLEDTGKRFLAQLIELTFQLLVIKPLLESLGDGGIGGAVSGVLSLFGGKSRASGGPVSAGQVYRVNEGTRPEYFKPNTGGDIIPLSKMSAAPMASAQGGGVSVIRLELSGDIDARIVSTSAQVAVEVVRANVPSIVELSAAKARYDIVRPTM